MKRFYSVLCMVFLLYKYSTGQIILNESFDNTTFVPTGWYQARTNPTGTMTWGYWDRVSSAAVATHSGNGMARFNSPSNGFGTITELGTPALDFSDGKSYRVKYWMYRSANAPLSQDLLEIYVNQATSVNGATKLGENYGTRMQAPVETADGWYQYSFDIPASFNTATNYIIFRATGKNSAIFYIDDVVVESYTCHKPSNVLASGITKNTADFSWDMPAGNPLRYEWELRMAGSPGTGSVELVANGTTTGRTASITQLIPGGRYKFYVRSVCTGDSSIWSVVGPVVLPCDAVSGPYIENFDAITTGLPLCTSAENNGTGNSWNSSLPQFPSSYSYSAPNAIYKRAGGSPGGNDWFFTVPLNLVAGKCYQLKFAYRCYYWQTPEALEVKLGTAQQSAAMTSGLLFNKNKITNDQYVISDTIFRVNVSGTYFIGFHYYSPGGSSGLLIDNIGVQEMTGRVENITVPSLTPSTASLQWAGPSCGSFSGFEWELRTSGTAGTGTTGLVNSGSGNAATLGTSFSSLSENQTYIFYIRAVNGASKGDWNDGYSFKTSCNIVGLPYYENFDGVTVPNTPLCINIQNVSGAGVWKINHQLSRSSPNCMRYEYSAAAADDWFFTPPFNFTAGTSYRLRFYYMAYLPYEPESLEVKYGNSPNAAAMTSSPIFLKTGFTNTVYKQAVVDFTPTTGGTYSLGFHAISEPLEGYLRIDDIALDRTPLCDSVREINATDISPTSGTLNWLAPLAGSVVTSYTWEVRGSGAAGSGSAGLVNSGQLASNALNVAVNGLTANTTYTFYIKPDCGSSQGNWVAYKFTSACLPASIPYTENFDGDASTNMPSCTKVVNVDNDQTWHKLTNSIYANSAPNVITYRFHGNNNNANDWFYTAPLNLVGATTYRLTFKYRVYDASFRESLEVKIGKYAQASSMTSPALFNSTQINNTSYQQATLEFTPDASGTYYIGFHCYSPYSRGELYLDDISVVGMIGVPTGVFATSITTNTAFIKWAAPLFGDVSGYEWELRTTGNPGSGTTGLVNAGNGDADTLATNFGSLQGGQNYSFYIRAVDGVIKSEWTTYSFKTPCTAASLPYYENFDGVTAPALPGCISIENVNGGSTWSNKNNPVFKSSPNCMMYEYDKDNRDADDWFFTPSFNFIAGTSYRLSFYYMAHYPHDPESLEVKYGIAANAASMTGSPIFSKIEFTNTTYKQAVVDFTPTASGTYSVGFHAISYRVRSYIRVDDIRLDRTPVCDSVRQISASDISSNNATLNWLAPLISTVSGYNWELRTSGAAGSGNNGLISSGQLASNALNVGVSGLTAGSPYIFYIKSGCGSNQGGWVAYTFTSACLPVSVPYTENFDGDGRINMPPCTKIVNIDDDQTWHKEANSYYAYSAPYSMTYNASGNNPNVSYSTGHNNNADDWFYTAPLSLVAERTYQLSFRYRVDYSSQNQRLEVKIGNYAQESAMLASPLFSSVQINNEVYQQAVIDFTPSASGIYYIGFHCTSYFSYSWGSLFVDDISVKNRYSVLSNFTTTVKEQSVLLNWQTEIELNNKEFVVERSLDGVNFSAIGTVASKAVAGNSDTNLSYLFEDNLPINGVSYYRLKQVDKGGDSRYSEVRKAVYLTAKVNAIKSCSADFSSSITAAASTISSIQFEYGLNDFANSGASNPSTINNQQTSVTFTAKNLLEATAYKMRIKAEFEGQTFYSSPVFFTTTGMPPAPTITIAGRTVFCSGANATLSSSSADGNQWYKDGVAIDGATARDYIAVNSGVYALRVTNNGCVSQVSPDVNITALELPSAVIVASGATAFCEGENVILSASTTVGNTYQWHMNGNPIHGAILSSHTANETGTYTIVIASNNGCSKTSSAIDVTVTANPVKPVITATGNILSSSAVTGNQWLLNGIIIPAATNQQYNVQSSGQYTVKVSHNGCSAVSDVFNFVSTAITNPSAWNNEVLIYPNPVTDKIFVTNSGGRKLRIHLIDIAGRRVYETRSSGVLVTIPVKQLTSAIYLVVVTDENKNETITKTIVKQ